MAIVKPLIKMMIENDRNYHGNLLTFGEQEVLIERNVLENYLGKKFEISSVINSKKIFQSLGFEKIDTLEFIGNKSANIEHDLNLPIPKKHHSRYEFILDSGHMEHCFNVPEIMKSIFYLLKENGTVIHLNPFQGNANHGFYCFQPTFYFSFYKACKFENIELFLLESGDPDFKERTKVIKLEENFNNLDYSPKFSPSTYILCFATKTSNSGFCYPNIEFYHKIFEQKKKSREDKIPLEIYNEIVGNVPSNNYKEIIKDSKII